jgi:predicted ATPase
MIERLYIRNFKCFESISLRLAPLTLLTGFNAAGKSTVLQSILMLAQALQQGGRSRQLPLNGPFMKLGTPGDVLREGGPPELTIGVESADARIEWQLFTMERRHANALSILQIEYCINGCAPIRCPVDLETELRQLLPLNAPADIRLICQNLTEVIFLSAVRNGAEEIFPVPEMAEPVWADVGTQGEYAAWWFEKLLEDIDVEPARRHPSDAAPSLRRQFNAWASELFPGAEANAQRISQTALVRLELRNHESDEWRRPANIGYGLSYAFPILVAGLIARPGQILIIDSPEAHLHPMGQSRIGVFLAMLAQSGVQVIVETHSDHVLNGIRLSVSRRELPPGNLAIHFFNPRPRNSDEPAHVVSPQVDYKGNLSEWPIGFFDQAEKDLAILAGWV